MTDLRFQALTQWCKSQLSDESIQLDVVSDDASFRRYFRIHANTASLNPLCHQPLIAVDAPPDKENSSKFIAIAAGLDAHGVKVPRIIKSSETQGFMILDDFGDDLLFSHLNDLTVDNYYQQAMQSLLHLKDCSSMTTYQLPAYNEQLLNSEMLLFSEWFLAKHLGFKEPKIKFPELDSVFKLLIQSAVDQPQVCVHRDFHCRNIMLLKTSELGIIDFQDAVLGPITYDLVSLLKDCYISWPREKVVAWVEDYYNHLVKAKHSEIDNVEQFIRWFDFMGMQRHIKVLGIFARLNYRDNKPAYLNDMPMTLNYLIECCSYYPEFKDFGESLKSKVLPFLKNRFVNE
ncbi:MAG: aminoglycoside/choline kinase family phosphotransferase [Enterobacterales bacterium]|jgi:aminoglycoside/choline kinase family phosphotransferase